MSGIVESMSPAEWGLPGEKFSEWRPGQAQIVEDIIDCPTQYGAFGVPAGVGKSPAYVAAAKITDSRVCILTAHKTLQTQILTDFESMGMVDIRGKSNYNCDQRRKLSCEEAWSVCKAKEYGQCPYKQAYDVACRANIVSTNYSYWLNRTKATPGALTKVDKDDEPVPFDMLVCDEAHLAMGELAGFIAVELSNEDMTLHIKSQVPDHTLPMPQWKSYAAQYLPIVRRRVTDMEAALKMGIKMDDRELKDYTRLTYIQAKLDTLARCNPDMWIVEPSQYGFKFDPVWPGFYARNLFQDIKRIVLMSATIRPKTLQLLGIKSADYTFHEYPSPFNPNDGPIYHIPTARIWHGATNDELKAMYSRVDEILGARLDRKGIIHSVSYRRAQEIKSASRYRRFMETNYRGGPPTSEVIELFKKMPPPSYLVSPSVVAGHDFGGSLCEVNIIPKLSVPDQRSAVMKERLKRDPEYADYLTVQDLVQACGRGNRFIGDRCQTLITDDSIRRYLWKSRHQFPKYFFDFFRTAGTVPKPLLKMPSGGPVKQPVVLVKPGALVKQRSR